MAIEFIGHTKGPVIVERDLREWLFEAVTAAAGRCDDRLNRPWFLQVGLA
jgi:hypothetical protein